MKDFKLILIFIIFFIAIRSLHFSEFLNFSFDQAWSSQRALEIWQNKEITLVGPGNSMVANGKQVIQGSINYYFHLLFLLLGNFDPVNSSYLLMIVLGLMIIPLYYGVKMLHGKKAAVWITLMYMLLPYFIDFTRFFFGPVFQIFFLHILILFMGLYKKYKRKLYLFLVFFLAGILIQFHYQALVVVVILLLYYVRKSNEKLLSTIIAIFGLSVGSSPLIVFEVKNQFYNLKVLLEYIQYTKKPSDFFFIPHRYLSISLLLLVVTLPFYKRFITIKSLFSIGIFLFLLDLFFYLPLPKNAFGMSQNWNYPMEKKAYEIIKKEHLKSFNIVNHIYDNKSVVIKYLLKVDAYDIDYDDYYHNRYLFVVSNSDKIFKDPAYEINTFWPNEKLKQWKLNKVYNLYLFKRLDT